MSSSRITLHYSFCFALYEIDGAKAKQKNMGTNELHGSKSSLNGGLQITVGNGTLANQNLLMSDQSLTVVGLNA